jgi:uncharacterized membrane protein
MIFLILLCLALFFAVALVIRRQSYFQHRELIKAIDPERIAREDAIDRARAQKVVNLFIGILVFFGLLFLLAFCAQFKGFGPDPYKPAPRTELQP